MNFLSKPKIKIPDTYILVVFFIAISAILTFVIPAGEFNRINNPETGLTLADPTSYHQVQQNPVSIEQMLLAIPIGMNKSASLINLILLVSGFLQIVNDTGAVDRLIRFILQKLKNKSILILPIIIVMMSVLGAIGALAHSVVAFVPLGLIICSKLRLDPLVAVAITFAATYTGFGASPIVPVTVQLAQKIAEVPILSGLGIRVFMTVATTLILSLYTTLYAIRIQRNPEKSIFVFQENPLQMDSDSSFADDLKIQDILIVVSLFSGFGIYSFGTLKFGWGTEYMSGIMFAIAIISSIIAKISPDNMVKSFISGCKGVVYACLITGFASGITYILNEGRIIDTIIYFLSMPLKFAGALLSSYLMLFINIIINFFIPAGSGQAAVVMPILAPVSDIVGMNRQVAVYAFQWGDLLSNLFNPTSGTTMACLALAGVPFNKWLKYILPLCGLYLVVILITLLYIISIGA